MQAVEYLQQLVKQPFHSRCIVFGMARIATAVYSTIF